MPCFSPMRFLIGSIFSAFSQPYVLFLFLACRNGGSGYWITTIVLFLAALLVMRVRALNARNQYWSAPASHPYYYKFPESFFFRHLILESINAAFCWAIFFWIYD